MQRAFDKIIERLRDSGERYEDIAFAEMNENGQTLDFEYAHGKKDAMLESIEIVNQVASEYDEEVCEWERQDLTVGFQSWFTKCRETGLEMQGHIFNEWKFCPYCGKKIKAIEPYKAESEE